MSETLWTPATQLPPRFKNGPESVVVLAVAETGDGCLQITPAKVASFTKGEWREVRFDHDGMGRKIVVRCWTPMPAFPKSFPDREAARQPAVDPSIKAAYEAGAAEARKQCAATWEKVIATAMRGERYDDILRRYNEAILAGGNAEVSRAG